MERLYLKKQELQEQVKFNQVKWEKLEQRWRGMKYKYMRIQILLELVVPEWKRQEMTRELSRWPHRLKHWA